MRSGKPRARAFTALGIAAAAVAPAASAQDFLSQRFISPYEEWLTIDLGGIVNRFDSTVRLDGQGGQGTPISLESNALERHLRSFESAFTWRIAKVHRIDFEYYAAKRSGSRDYSTQIDIGDASFPLGATVSVEANSRLANVDYRYSFVQNPQFEAAVLLGLYGGKFTYDVDAVGSAGSAQASYHKSVSTSLPLPMLGATIDWYPDNRWKLGARVQGMKAKVGDVDGHAFLAAASVEWMATRNFGVGARYAYTDIEADVTKSSFLGNLGWTANSVSLYGKLVF